MCVCVCVHMCIYDIHEGATVFKITMNACMLSCVQLFATPWTVIYQAPLSMEFSRREYLSELPFPPPGDLPDSGTEFPSPAWTYGFFTAEPPKRPQLTPKSVQIKVL